MFVIRMAIVSVSEVIQEEPFCGLTSPRCQILYQELSYKGIVIIHKRYEFVGDPQVTGHNGRECLLPDLFRWIMSHMDQSFGGFLIGHVAE